jgi:glycosyltransferase involved in cell wall biosynthesis
VQPKLTIITVTYNAERFLEPTIKSIAAQTYPNIEYVIVDGGSKDGTVDIIKKYLQVVTNYISEPDNGLYDAMNKGLQLATGDYIMALNAGDLLDEPETIAKTFAKCNNEDVLFGDTKIIDTNYQFVGMRHFTPPENLTWKSFQQGMVVCHQSIISKKEITPTYDLNYKIAADIDWAIRLLKNAKSSKNVHEIITRFMQDGVSTQHRWAGVRERFGVMIKYFGLLTTLWNNISRGLHYFLTLRFLKNVRK